MGAWLGGAAIRRLDVDHSGLLARAGAVISFSFVAGAWLYLRPAVGGPVWHRVAATVLVAVVFVCLAAMLKTDAWPLRLIIVFSLIPLSELAAGVDFRLDSESLLVAHSMLMAASASVVLSLRGSWQSAAFTALLGAMVFGHTVATSLVHGLGPTTVLTLLAAWSIMLAIRWAVPPALAQYRRDQDVRRKSLEAQAAAHQRMSARQQDARTLHDTVLRTLAVIGRGGEGATPDELRELVSASAYDGGSPGSAATGSASPREAGDAQGDGKTVAPSAVVVGSNGADAAGMLERMAERRSGNGCTVEVFGEAGTLPEGLAAAICDAADECVVNAVRHSGTERVDVLLSRTGSRVCVVISDSGTGFDPGAIPADRLGVRHSVVERMRDAGGAARVMSSPGRGTTVVLDAEVP
ncbi:sensor histidine kinase [Paenarthrobacter sp. NCHU4564]|uniref:sensor histidine kinase n=1 Tax=Paenarthrobacter sp. NCHU4564 TaxID=3451353 RepID=UPI003F9574B7